MTSVKLYSQLLNPFTEKVACALALKGVPYLRTEVSGSEEVKRLSPDKQTLPVLEIDGKRVADSNAIIAWLDELYPEPSLYSLDPTTRRQQERLAEWSDSSFAFYWNRWLAVTEEHERQEREATPGLLTRIHQHVDSRLGIEHEASSEDIPGVRSILSDLENRMNDLVGFLGSRDYFFSDELSVADLAVYGMLLVMRDGPMPRTLDMLNARPTLARHIAQMSKLSRGGTGTREEEGEG
ncbi:MAG: glutathione S-transferase family protein [Myxococcota bacterium]|jgi:glutathione S-transferase|nr:glutathione S-transferase family protein [Myxococcota bacterium]